MIRSHRNLKTKLLFLTLIAEGMIRRFLVNFSKNSHRQKKINILVMRLDLLGDFILWVPFGRLLRAKYPADRYSISFIGNSSWISIAEKLLEFDEFIGFDIKMAESNFKYFRTFLIQNSKKQIHISLNPRFTRLIHEDLINLFSFAPNSVAFIHTEPDSNRIITHLMKQFYSKLINDEPEKQHMYLKNHSFLVAIEADHLPVIPIDIKNEFNKKPNLNYNKYFLIFPSASSSEKTWNWENFAKISKKIKQITNFTPIICGTNQESLICQRVFEKSEVQCINLAGKTNLDDIVQLICSAELIVGNDSGAIHIAALAGIPSLCIMSGAHYKYFVPYPEDTPDWIIKPICVYHEMPCFQCDWVCTQRVLPTDTPVPCLAAIRFEDVEKIIDHWLKPKYSPAPT
jgi:ADP-heptose:LPS heptosyltransferase